MVWIKEKLDHTFIFSAWLNCFPSCKLKALMSPISNHLPILLSLSSGSSIKCSKRFKFENVWLKEAKFYVDFKKFWASLTSGDLLFKLETSSSFLVT